MRSAEGKSATCTHYGSHMFTCNRLLGGVGVTPMAPASVEALSAASVTFAAKRGATAYMWLARRPAVSRAAGKHSSPKPDEGCV